MSESKTVSLSTPDGSISYNVDNIAFLKIDQVSLKWLAWLAILSPILAGFSYGVLLDEGALLFFGVLASVIVWIWIKDSGSVEIGTVTRTDTIDEFDGKSDLVNAFKRKSENTIVVTGKEETKIRIHDYVYVFAPNNIVSMSETRPSNTLFLIVLLFAFVSVIPALEEPTYGVITLAIAAVAILLYDGDRLLSIDLQSGESKEFVMSSEDVNRVMSEFRHHD